MTAANPYFIYIDLFLSDGVTRPTQNQIARVQAFDVNGTTVTDEGQSGFNPATGGWMPVFMQNIAAFSPPRDQPNLKFEVFDTTNALVYTTQVFSAIPSGSTVKIVIGISASIEGTGSFTVTGHVRNAAGAPVNSGTATATDVTNGSTATLGLVALATDGSYSISFLPTQFANNGSPHVLPNLQITALDGAGQFLAQSPIVIGAANNAVIDLTVAAPPQTEANTVFGAITNSLGLPVAGVFVQAYDVVWTTAGIQELSSPRRSRPTETATTSSPTPRRWSLARPPPAGRPPTRSTSRSKRSRRTPPRRPTRRSWPSRQSWSTRPANRRSI